MTTRRSHRSGFEWNISATKVLINLYEANEHLYNPSHADYKNRALRQETLSSCAEGISDTTGTVCLVTDVRKKINNLRSQYLAEKQKVNKSECIGENYTPTAYWFPLLHFLDDSTSNMDESNYQSLEPEVEVELSSDSNGTSQHGTRKRQRKAISSSAGEQITNDIINRATNTSLNMSHAMKQSTNSDNISSFSKFISSELHSMLASSNMSYVNKAKREIQQVMFRIWDEVEKNNISRPPSALSSNADDT